VYFTTFVDCRCRQSDGAEIFRSCGSWTESIKESSP